MNSIQNELIDIRNSCENTITCSRLLSCEETIVAVEIVHSLTIKLIACLRFPIDGYPKNCLLIELKSKTLSDRFLNNLTKICEEHCKSNLLGKEQVIAFLKFLSNTLQKNPLCVCHDELISLKEFALKANFTLKLCQRRSCIILKSRFHNYIFNVEATIPPEYPYSKIEWTLFEGNFPNNLMRYLNAQAKEIVRKNVEPPLREYKNEPSFKVQPCLEKTCKFLILTIQYFLNEVCPVCKQKCLPKNSKDIVTDEDNQWFVERAHCGHIYHSGCLQKIFLEPPFPIEGKLCLATDSKEEACRQKLTHYKWTLNSKKAEQSFKFTLE
ncbi:uncharacterized protein LOC134827954 isoform X2 [Culicoides brevitarsis]|uniref:uncharacterized protein LOC134827954 isoform X2 n=1 Tax=Culicoides brevitarsis TaxID=469753 RepID=UPI00307C9D3A